jgi:hypothetical protein
VRHILAALDLTTGKIFYRIQPRKRHHEFLELLKALRTDFGKLKWPRCVGCGVGRHLDLAHSPVAAKCGTLIWPHVVWVFLLAREVATEVE